MGGWGVPLGWVGHILAGGWNYQREKWCRRKVSKGRQGNYYEILYKLSCFNPIHLVQHACLKWFQLEDGSQNMSIYYQRKVHWNPSHDPVSCANCSQLCKNFLCHPSARTRWIIWFFATFSSKMIWCPLPSDELLSCDLWPPTNQWLLPTRVRLFANPPSQGILILRQPSNTSTNTNKQDTTRASQNVYRSIHTGLSHGNTESDAPCKIQKGKGRPRLLRIIIPSLRGQR